MSPSDKPTHVKKPRPPKHGDNLHVWIKLTTQGIISYRMEVPGGWLYSTFHNNNTSISRPVFVPLAKEPRKSRPKKKKSPIDQKLGDASISTPIAREKE